jgi:hypothetical protein
MGEKRRCGKHYTHKDRGHFGGGAKGGEGEFISPSPVSSIMYFGGLSSPSVNNGLE